MMYRVCVVLALIVALLVIGCTSQQYVPNDSIIYGRWINDEYSGKITEFQKLTIGPDELKYYYKVADRIPFLAASHYTIVDKWYGSGSSLFGPRGIWYKIEWEDPGTAQLKYYGLARIGKSGSTLEFVDQQATQGWPTEIDKNHANYRIYYRQKGAAALSIYHHIAQEDFKIILLVYRADIAPGKNEEAVDLWKRIGINFMKAPEVEENYVLTPHNGKISRIWGVSKISSLAGLEEFYKRQDADPEFQALLKEHREKQFTIPGTMEINIYQVR